MSELSLQFQLRVARQELKWAKECMIQTSGRAWELAEDSRNYWRRECYRLEDEIKKEKI